MASLVVSGVRRFVGLPWRTRHRGKLWIVSTRAAPSKGQIAAAQSFYTQMYTGVKVPLPAKYPPSTVVGYVHIDGCMAQEEYRRLVLDATSPLENHAPWLWQCEKPHIIAPEFAPTVRKSFKVDTSELVRLPSAVQKSAEKHVHAAPLAWRPTQALAPVLLRRLSSQGGSASSAIDICPGANALAGATDIISHAAFVSSHDFRTQKLRPGMVVLKGFLPPDVQARLVAIVRKLGTGEGGFYRPRYDTGAALHCDMMCLGRHWNPIAGAYEPTRTNLDDAPAPLIPAELLLCVRHAIAEAVKADPRCAGHAPSGRSAGASSGGGQPRVSTNRVSTNNLGRGRRHDAVVGGSAQAVRPFHPDVVLCNYYTASGRMGLHQDKHESQASLQAGSPVVSLSIGDMATFGYCRKRPRDGVAESTVDLVSGDVLVFGGPSRMVYHGVAKIHPHTAPSFVRSLGGRLNLTFRQSVLAEESAE